MILYVIIGVLVLVVVGLIFKGTKRNVEQAVVVKRSLDESTIPVPRPPASQRSSDVAPKEAEFENVNEIVIGTSENRPYALLTVMPKGFRPEKNVKDMQITGKAWERLAPVIQIAPSVLTAASESGSTYMKVVVDGTLARAADGDGYRGFVRDATTGKFVKHGRFYDAKSLKEMITLTAGFQVLSVVVGQAHLVAINKKLAAIQDGVKDVIFILENQRESKIKAIFQHLSEYNMAVSNGEMSESYRVNIEQTDLELKSLVIELENEITQKSKKLKIYEDNEKFGCADLHKELVDVSSQINDLTNQLFICIECRVMACQLICYFPNSNNISEIRLRQIKNDIDRITGHDGVLERAKEVVLSRVNEIDSSFTKDETIEQRRTEVRGKYAGMKAQALQYKNEIDADLSGSDRLLQAMGKPVEMLVKIEGGKVQEAMLLSNVG
jgi:hypothetical protein